MIIKNNQYLWVPVTRDEGEIIQYFAAEKGFYWRNGRKIHRPYLPNYALAFDLENKVMYFYSLKEAEITWPKGKRSKLEIKKILKELKK